LQRNRQLFGCPQHRTRRSTHASSPHSALSVASLSEFFAYGAIKITPQRRHRFVAVDNLLHPRANSPQKFSYMHNVEHSLGLQVHAMLLSLPPVLLVWAIVAFTASIIAYSLQGLGNRGQDPATAWAVVGIFVLILFAVSTLLYSFSVIWTPTRSRFRFRP
jgi:hypothetical protein